MASNIDPSKPADGDARTPNVRANFQASKDEIEALQVLSSSNEGRLDTAEPIISSNTSRITAAEGRLDGHDADIADRYVKAEVYTKVEADNLYTRWKGSWAPGTYEKGDQVLHNGWLAVANKTTTDQAAPIESGGRYWVSGLGDSPAWTVDQVTSNALYTGVDFTVNQTVYLTGYRMWIPVAGSVNYYRAISVRNPGEATEEILMGAQFNANDIGWMIIPTGLTILLAGQHVQLWLETIDKTSSASFEGNWNYTRDPQPVIPLDGQISHSDRALNSFRVSKIDNDGGDRSAELLALFAGDNITGQGVTWTIQSFTDMGTWIEFTVQPGAQGSAGVGPFTFTSYVPQPTSYVQMTNHYQGNPDLGGLYSIDGLNPVMVLNDNAYGVDIELQNMTVSPDWDLQSYTSF